MAGVVAAVRAERSEQRDHQVAPRPRVAVHGARRSGLVAVGAAQPGPVGAQWPAPGRWRERAG